MGIEFGFILFPLPNVDKPAGVRMRHKSERADILSLTRRCVADKARLRRERWATPDDAVEFFCEMRRPVGNLRKAVAEVFAGPEWEFTGLWTATRHQIGRRMPRLVRMYRLTTPAGRRLA